MKNEFNCVQSIARTEDNLPKWKWLYDEKNKLRYSERNVSKRVVAYI